MTATPAYAEQVEACGEAILDYILDTYGGLARDDLMHDALTGPLTGTFILTAGGRTRWRGRTLAGALTAQLSMPMLPLPVRVWHTDTSGQRRLVLVSGSQSVNGDADA